MMKSKGKPIRRPPSGAGSDYNYRTAPDLQDEFRDEEQELDFLSGSSKNNPFVLKELGQVAPPDYPLRWKDKPESERPHSPQVEYIRNPYPLEITVLARRWEGLHTYEEIEQEYFANNWRLMRFQYQAEVNRQALTASLATDTKFREAQINESIVRFSTMSERLHADFESGYEFDKSGNAGPMGYVKRPLSVKSKTALAAAAIAVDNLLMTRVGVATEIHQNNHNVKIGVQATLQEHLLKGDPEYAELMRIAGAVNQRFASDAPALGPGDSIHDVREQFEATPVGEPVGGRIIDVEAQ